MILPSATARRPLIRTTVVLLLLLLTACAREPISPELEDISQVAIPDEMDRRAREQYRQRWQRLDQARANPHLPKGDLAIAYAEVGLWYQAYRFFDLAASCYRNAGKLSPGDFRWAYYLGHIAVKQGDKAAARKHFEFVLGRRSRYVPGLISLAEVEMEDNLQKAEELFERVLRAAPQCARAHFGLGQIALERREHAAAIRRFEQVLAEQPKATSVHYALGMAYRGQGDLTRARTHLEQAHIKENAERVPLTMMDPLLERLQQLRQQRPSIRIKRAEMLFSQRRYFEAAEILRGEIAEKEDDAGLWFLLGLVYRSMGKIDMAMQQFEEALHLKPTHAPAHFQLAVLLAQESQDAAAENHFRQALEADPGHRNAHFRYGNLLQQQNRFAAALDHYSQAVELNGTSARARFKRVVCLVRLGRWAEAHEAIEESLLILPRAHRLRHLQARLLATNPKAELRDGRRAMQLVSISTDAQVGVQQVETMAMALAELGRFDDAIRWQNSALEAARVNGKEELVAWINARLALYQRGEPCRQVWVEGEPETLSALPSKA